MVFKFPGDTVFLATHNAGKIEEFRVMLAPHIARILTPADVEIDEPEETGATFLENATIKALAGARHTGMPCLADDSGLCVNALEGNPGIYSARWGGANKDIAKARALVHERMGDAVDRSAYFMAVLVLAMPDGACIEAQGRVDGQIVWPGRGSGGHGYDPIFVPDGDVRTFAQMSMDEKNAYSHRARALQALIDKIF